MRNQRKPRSRWLSIIKRSWQFILCVLANVCLNLDRIGRFFDAHQLTETTVTVFNHAAPALDVCLALFRWSFGLLFGAWG